MFDTKVSKPGVPVQEDCVQIFCLEQIIFTWITEQFPFSCWMKFLNSLFFPSSNFIFAKSSPWNDDISSTEIYTKLHIY